VCDLKCLIEVLGLYDVFHPKAKWKCPWCNVSDSNVHHFGRNSWEFRDLNKMKEVAAKYSHQSDSTRNTKARMNQGIKVIVSFFWITFFLV